MFCPYFGFSGESIAKNLSFGCLAERGSQGISTVNYCVGFIFYTLIEVVGEEEFLCLCVLFQGMMIVQMFRRQIGKYRNVKIELIYPVLIQ